MNPDSITQALAIWAVLVFTVGFLVCLTAVSSKHYFSVLALWVGVMLGLFSATVISWSITHLRVV